MGHWGFSNVSGNFFGMLETNTGNFIWGPLLCWSLHEVGGQQTTALRLPFLMVIHGYPSKHSDKEYSKSEIMR